MNPYDIIGWLVVIIFLLLVFIFVNAFTSHKPKPPKSPVEMHLPEMNINLTVNGLKWKYDAKWEYIKDKKVAEYALVDLLNKVHQQEKA